jgi:hypothetical protein
LRGNPWLGSQFDFAARAVSACSRSVAALAAPAACSRARARSSRDRSHEQAVQLAQATRAPQGLAVDVRRMEPAARLSRRQLRLRLLVGVIHHSRATESIIGEIARVLRPGGRGS